MKPLKLLPAALLMIFSLGAFAQDDDDELLAATADEDATAEVLAPTLPTEKSLFQRVQIGFLGTNVKYSNFGLSPDYNNFFLTGVSVGWAANFRIAKKIPLYLDLGATLAYHTGKSKGDSIYSYHSQPGDLGDGEYTKRHYRIQAFSITIPVSVSYQFRDAFHVDGLTLAPFAGLYFRFNVVCNRWETMSSTSYYNGVAQGDAVVSRINKSLMSEERDGGWWSHKTHVGKLCQPGAQIGVNAYYHRYSFGIAYMRDLINFAGHHSSPELTSKSTKEGGNLPSIGTNCDEKVSTANNFAIIVGYTF